MLQEVIPELIVIQNKPTVVDDMHQSVFRSHAVLNYIMKMVKRGDSKETIEDVYFSLMNSENRIKSEDLVPQDLQTK